MNKPNLLDRSRITAFWHCPRKRYLQYEFKGKGIVKSATSLPLFTGISVHDCLATIAQFQKDGVEIPIDDIASSAFNAMKLELMEASNGEVGAHEFAMEQATLVEGMVRGFHKYVWPILMDQYPTILAVEKEMQYDLGIDASGTPTIFMAKPDLVVEGRDGEVVYIEYKTTSSKKLEWIQSWNTAVQLHSSIKAAEQTLGIQPTHVQVVGLYKGYRSYNKQNSPFCYAYKKNGNPPFSKDQILYEYKSGFFRAPVWEMEGGVKEWINNMPDEILANQFPLTPQITVDEDLVNRFFKQTQLAETDIAIASQMLETSSDEEHKQGILDAYFPQRFDQCVPAFGYSCEFRKICHGGCKDPLNEGFEVRQPHHKPEEEEFQNE